VSETRRGLLLGIAAYALWGLFPLYWPLLEPAGAIEILGHRVVWSLVVMVVLLVLARRGRQFAEVLRAPRTRAILAVAAVLITVNWGTYIWGVNNAHVVETSLGYFINPLVTVLLGVFVLGERLRRLQWIAIALAGVAVLALTVEYGRPPWVALVLAFSFGSYGLAKKKADTGAVESLAVETAVITPVALGYLVWLSLTGSSNFTDHGPGHVALMVSTGIVTAIPLICFGAAATRVSMTAIGLLQYLTPTIQFAIGVLVLHEPMPASRLAGFALIWIALALFTAETLSHHRRQMQLAVEAAAL
jgi:chloramphenicol-sensitive protein RarD